MYFTTDTVADAVTTDDSSSSDDFTLDEASIVTIDNPPHERAFDTERFYKFDTIVARPIEQDYIHDGERKTFKKPAEELKDAAWSLDNKPYPLTHPDTKLVTDVDEIHGFHRSPRYVEDFDADGDAVVTSLYVPTTDETALTFLSQYRDVSVGVFNDLDWKTDESGVDAYQTNLYFDHVAGVEKGRCSGEDGCGIMTDSDISLVDGVHISMTEDASFSVGDTVKWSWSSGTAHGKIDEVVSEEGETVSASGNTRKAKADRNAYKIEVYRDDSGEYSGYAVKLAGENDLSSWAGPTADSCMGDTCSCGCHIDVDSKHDDVDLTPNQSMQDAAQRVLDARDNDDKDVSGMTDHGWSRAEQLASGEALSKSDVINDSGAMAPWWSRHAPDTVRGSGDSLSLQRDESVDNWWKDNSYVSGLGWGGISGYRWAIRKGNDLKEAMGEEPNYSLDEFDSNMTDEDSGTDSIDFESIVGGMTVDAIAEKNENVQELTADKEDAESKVDVLEDKVDSLEADLDEATTKLEQFENGEREPKSVVVDSITDLTSAWDEDDLMELDREALDRRKEIAEDAAMSPSTPEDEGSEGGADEPTTDDAADDSGPTVSNKHRSWG